MKKNDDKKFEEFIDKGENIVVSVHDGKIMVATSMTDYGKISIILAAALKEIDELRDSRGTDSILQ